MRNWHCSNEADPANDYLSKLDNVAVMPNERSSLGAPSGSRDALIWLIRFLNM